MKDSIKTLESCTLNIKESVDPNQQTLRPCHSSCLLCYKASQLLINGRHLRGRMENEEL